VSRRNGLDADEGVHQRQSRDWNSFDLVPYQQYVVLGHGLDHRREIEILSEDAYRDDVRVGDAVEDELVVHLEPLDHPLADLVDLFVGLGGLTPVLHVEGRRVVFGALESLSLVCGSSEGAPFELEFVRVVSDDDDDVGVEPNSKGTDRGEQHRTVRNLSVGANGPVDVSFHRCSRYSRTWAR